LVKPAVKVDPPLHGIGIVLERLKLLTLGGFKEVLLKFGPILLGPTFLSGSLDLAKEVLVP
jgi:hypothetical protein